MHFVRLFVRLSIVVNVRNSIFFAAQNFISISHEQTYLLMSHIATLIKGESPDARKQFIVDSFVHNYQALIQYDPDAWRGKFRKMAQSPFAFYRGSAALFYADVSRDEDPFLNEQTSRVWIQGDLHAENFGTYMNGAGQLVFDVNDFDEAYVAPFTWDVKRFCASLALIGYAKAMSDKEIREMVEQGARGYARQVARFAAGQDKNFSLRLDNTDGVVLDIIREARTLTRVGLLNDNTEIKDGDRRFTLGKYHAALTEAEQAKVKAALEAYYETIPTRKRRAKPNYAVKDVVRRLGTGIGSAGLEIFSVLLEGESQALENDIVISMKVAQPSAMSAYVQNDEAAAYFIHDGHRTTISQRALQAFADPLLGYATIDGKGLFVTEVSPYTADLDWSEINSFEDIIQVISDLSRCVAKIHCVSDEDSDQTLVNFSTEEAIHGAIHGREAEFISYISDFAEQYAACVRHDYLLFIDAFRNKEIPGI